MASPIRFAAAYFRQLYASKLPAVIGGATTVGPAFGVAFSPDNWLFWLVVFMSGIVAVQSIDAYGQWKRRQWVRFKDPPEPPWIGSWQFVRVQVINDGPETVPNAHGEMTIVAGGESQTFQMRWTGTSKPADGIVTPEMLLKDLRPGLTYELDVASVVDGVAHAWTNQHAVQQRTPFEDVIDADEFEAFIRLRAEGGIEKRQRLRVWGLQAPRVDVLPDA